MRKIKVLHIGLSSNIGGIESVVFNWFQNIDREKIQFDFINVEDKPLAFEEDFLKGGCKIYRISSRKSNPLKSNKQLKEILINNHYEFVHHHVMGITWPEPILIASKIPGTLPIIHNHTVFGKNNGYSRVILNTLGHLRLVRCNYLKLACSYDAGNSVFPMGSFEVINNGIDYSAKKFNHDFRKEIREKYKISDGTVLIGHVGRACYEKNYPYILKTIAGLTKVNTHIKCMLVGDVNNDDSVKQLVKSLGLIDYVTFTGKVRNVEKYYSAFDFFFFPSIFEGVSVSLVEAQCSGLPCIISKNISKESEISDLIKYVNIDDVNDGVKVLLLQNTRTEKERMQIALKDEFEISQTVEHLMKFYKNSLLID